MNLLDVDPDLGLAAENGVAPIAIDFPCHCGGHEIRFGAGSWDLTLMDTFMPGQVRLLMEHFGAGSTGISLIRTVQVAINMQSVSFVLGYLFITSCAAVDWLLVVTLPVVEFVLYLRLEQPGTLVAGYR